MCIWLTEDLLVWCEIIFHLKENCTWFENYPEMISFREDELYQPSTYPPLKVIFYDAKQIFESLPEKKLRYSNQQFKEVTQNLILLNFGQENCYFAALWWIFQQKQIRDATASRVVFSTQNLDPVIKIVAKFFIWTLNITNLNGEGR